MKLWECDRVETVGYFLSVLFNFGIRNVKNVVNSTSFMLVAVHHAVCQTFVRAVPTYSSASYFGVPYLSSCPTFVGGSYSVQWRSRRVNLIVASCASCCPAPYLCFKVVEFCSAIMQHAIAVDKCDSLPCGSFLTFCCSGKQCFSCSCQRHRHGFLWAL